MYWLYLYITIFYKSNFMARYKDHFYILQFSTTMKWCHHQMKKIYNLIIKGDNDTLVVPRSSAECHFNLCVSNESSFISSSEFHYGDVGSELWAKVNNRTGIDPIVVIELASFSRCCIVEHFKSAFCNDVHSLQIMFFYAGISGTKHGKQILFTHFLHIMRCLNCWDNENFWGAKSGSPSPATLVKLQF